MKNAREFLEEVRALVETLPRDNAYCIVAVEALDDHNQEMLDLALSTAEPWVRAQLVIDSRQKLIRRLEDLHTHYLSGGK